jgi:hypothetical protein
MNKKKKKNSREKEKEGEEMKDACFLFFINLKTV